MDWQIWSVMVTVWSMAWVMIVIGMSTTGADEETQARRSRVVGLLSAGLGISMGLFGVICGLWAGLGGAL